MLREQSTMVLKPGEEPRVLFVCKGSMHDGMGHVIRSRTVALQMKSRAHVELVVIGPDYVGGLLEDKGLEYRVVSRQGEALAACRRFKPHLVVFDLTHLDKRMFGALAKDAATVSLSPIFNYLNAVDVVFHRTSIEDPKWSHLRRPPTVRCGLQYAVIGDHCHKISDQTYSDTLERSRLSVAVSMGGTDAANKTLEVIATLRGIKRRMLLWVLLGEGYDHSYHDLVDRARGAKHEIILAKTNDSMWHILSTCALAVLAGGTTTYQAAYAGLPSINTLETPNDYFLIQELVDKGLCLCAGDDFDTSLSRLNELVTGFDENRSGLLAMHRRSKSLLDGKGASRIVDETLALVGVPSVSGGERSKVTAE